jgi:hypothetical protein
MIDRFAPKAVDRQIWPQPSAIRGDCADRYDRSTKRRSVFDIGTISDIHPS